MNYIRKNGPGSGDQVGPSTSAQNLPFLQRRMALAAAATALLSIIFLSFRVISARHLGRLSLAHPSMLYHFAGVGVLLVIALVLRRKRQYGLPTLRIFETVALVCSSLCYGGMAVSLPPGFRPDFILLLALTYTVMTWSIIVPNTARHTAMLAGAIGVILVIASYTAFRGQDLSQVSPLYKREWSAPAAAVRTGVWWLLTLTLAAITSHVIYGLRREVHRAQQLGQYALEEKLGEGGMGVVYRASHAMLRRPTAIKLLTPDRAGVETIRRFEKEVRLTASLTHPNTVTIYDYGRTPDGVFYYAMELLDGATLEEIVEADGAQSASRVVHVASQIAAALVEAHSLGLIHRDIKPANVILCERGCIPDVAKVVDFGLVREVDASPDNASRMGVIAGTPLYLAPESIRSPDRVDARADLYSLGCVLYYLLAGQHVFAGRTAMEIGAHHLHSVPEPIGERAKLPVPAELAAVVMACLEKDAARRPQTAAELLARLQRCTCEPPWTPETARAWWKSKGPTLTAHRASRTKNAGNTLTVDFENR